MLNHLKNGGAKRDRTADFLHAMQALYQLSYGPDSGQMLGVDPNTVNQKIKIKPHLLYFWAVANFHLAFAMLWFRFYSRHLIR